MDAERAERIYGEALIPVDGGHTFLFGWWSLSGLFMTPVHIVRSIWALVASDRQTPSKALLDLAYWDLVQRGVEPIIYRPVDETGPLEVY